MTKLTILRDNVRKRKKLHVWTIALKTHSSETKVRGILLKLNALNTELKACKAELKECKAELRDVNRALEEIMFQTTHKIRQPITEILGLANLLDQPEQSQSELKKISDYLKHSISTLDTFTRNLIAFISNLLAGKK